MSPHVHFFNSMAFFLIWFYAIFLMTKYLADNLFKEHKFAAVHALALSLILTSFFISAIFKYVFKL